ncbi:hypothetical protein GVI60_06855 [Citrobacter freundii]|nr:hypothetical protein GVI60_06855 [Citrobacter freundii]
MKPYKALQIFILLMVFWSLGFVSHKYRIPPTNQIVSLYKYAMSVIGIERKNPNYPHIYDRETLFKSFIPKGEVAFLGDSITEGANWDQIFSNKKIANFGIGGNTIVGMVNISDLVVESGAKKIFIMGGVNDFSEMGYSVDKVFESYKKLIDKFNLNERTVFVQSTLKTKDTSVNSKIESLNSKLMDYCQNSGNCKFIDINKDMLDGNLLSSSFTTDGTHLNGYGYKKWYDAIKNLVQTN